MPWTEEVHVLCSLGTGFRDLPMSLVVCISSSDLDVRPASECQCLSSTLAWNVFIQGTMWPVRLRHSIPVMTRAMCNVLGINLQTTW